MMDVSDKYRINNKVKYRIRQSRGENVREIKSKRIRFF